MTDIILASASPRRREILKNAGIEFEIQKSEFEEVLENNIYSQEKIEKIALSKGLDVVKRFQDKLVISADTVVVLDNEIFTKPQNEQNAISMLSRLSNRTHFVQTTVCMLYNEKTFTKSTKTFVTFNELSKESIENYVKTYKPLDKAGAYGIQELPNGFVKEINGDLENVIGISSTIVKEMLQTFKHELS